MAWLKTADQVNTSTLLVNLLRLTPVLQATATLEAYFTAQESSNTD